MFSLFLTVLISGQPVTNTIDNVTFNSMQECNNYKMAMNYHNSNHLTFKCIESRTSEYWEEELQCDLYAIEQGHDQLEALMWLMYNHPAVYDSTRLKNLAKATGKTLPLLFRVIK